MGPATRSRRSEKVQGAVRTLLNVEATTWTEAELKPLFDKADTDRRVSPHGMRH